MKTNLDCVYCIIKKADERYGASEGDPARKLSFMKRVFQLIGESPEDVTAPYLSKCVNDLLKKEFGSGDDFSDLKSRYNGIMLNKENTMERTIDASGDSLRSALQMAMVGNLIDFAAMDTVRPEKLDELIRASGSQKIGEAEYVRFCEDLRTSGRMVYLLDNAGEIVCDKLLIKTIRRLYPHLQIMAVVRGQPVFNDVTMRDAEEAGLPDIVDVIDNGTDIPGTDLDRIDTAAGNALKNADVIVSKGQGNFETLYGCGKNIYYIFLCKCDLFVRRFGVPQLSGIFVNENRLMLT
jgi:uncharacterized protein with ATP-grasp and redox domains